ncbi:efflux ABC transporter permease [Mycolicibacterium cosmeticum]|uniref:Efflux ABC transporter permease n=2 Tax=Mycolicibacterium cosmeticum TaxID=258533 RepID=W9AY15_MYCCO|nr:efflux ABC transporter permease [Mycolicibacterium cosmeticum]
MADERLREEERERLAMRYGLSYGWLAARRRLSEMILPAITTATGAFLVVLVFGMSEGIRAQSASLGHADEIRAAVVLIAVTVLLVGVVEVAVATTRTVAQRTRELGVLGANGIARTPVVVALLVEPVIAAVLGAAGGALLAVITGLVLGALGFVPTGVAVGGLVAGTVIAVVVSIVAALATSVVPTWNAASRPPIRSLSSG